ncbi:MAG: GMC family oxidoreductase [Nocardioides sp.]|uniref:GMC family oxidoreductase n=1 Tax=Nocardioides sp. TaxID=35761 RepID=UPI0039E2333E
MPDRSDAIVVGLGAAGAIMADRLTAAGMRVLALDKGDNHLDRELWSTHDELRMYVRGDMLPTMRTDPLTWRADHTTSARVLPWAGTLYPHADPHHLPPSLGTGGGTVHWTGASWRFREADFRMRSTVRERYGASALPTDTDVVDWPLSYADLEPYYDLVEHELGVSGAAGNIRGRTQPGGNPFEAPRQGDYPMPPLRRAAADRLFVEAATRLGYHPFPQPAGIASVPFRGRPACTYCGFCHGYPCHTGAKSSSLVSSLPAALATGRLDIRTGCRVTRVRMDRQGRRIAGVDYLDESGRGRVADAQLVLLACYTLENTRLLFLSGIHCGGLVGRWFMTHNYGRLTGTLSEPTNGFMGAQAAASVFDDVTSELIPDNPEGALWGSPVISVPGDFQPIEAAHMRPATVPRHGWPLKEWLRDNFSRLFAICSQTANLPGAAGWCDLDPQVRDPAGLPALRITHRWTAADLAAAAFMMRIKRKVADEMGWVERWEDDLSPRYHVSNHDAGTYRMGEDPHASVVDPYGELHTCRGLYVLGGGQFPTFGSYNPTETIQALSYRTADHITGSPAPTSPVVAKSTNANGGPP